MGIFRQALEAVAAARERIKKNYNPVGSVVMGRQDYDGQLHPATDGIVLFKGTIQHTQSAAAHVELWNPINATISKRHPWFTANHLEQCEIELCATGDTASDLVLSDDYMFELTDATGAAILVQQFVADLGQMNHQNGNYVNSFKMPLSSATPALFGDWADWGATETGIIYVSVKITYYPVLTGSDL